MQQDDDDAKQISESTVEWSSQSTDLTWLKCWGLALRELCLDECLQNHRTEAINEEELVKIPTKQPERLSYRKCLLQGYCR